MILSLTRLPAATKATASPVVLPLHPCIFAQPTNFCLHPSAWLFTLESLFLIPLPVIRLGLPVEPLVGPPCGLVPWSPLRNYQRSSWLVFSPGRCLVCRWFPGLDRGNVVPAR